ncbi:PTS galactosamine/N-acetylgalactosamine transporter subunit IIA [Avibacterium paragallinarum]|uniref:PTS galactosamine/N-acetylgalactosamine transporter subunit IIA n=1 Tax=Avibacterium paragallinarum TaxID=728 RepID=A0AAE5TJ02_AVIPA|nr:PTS galactosamine/N-acetylgalactosamine transporter subunit IIA [Avibacterium paragallinarum]MEE3607939.1 PTS galactosamine/N-acetylgalactosamine transporter subunit IIA [Avibacterium paragallinarum]MEE3620930.1 PTS galactosamine/N-acetylgalactosamine transporter subunit IIA [Avibacterium paragallinarum]MEE3668011.1 PTS galactosamine/N-acetylgalactosamine transporter subunit IIA [Avibacterium paragallinarum]MEE3679783.1 PTS galactosamine/N-acetylgalactosamine transporter subunit IIA [Avibact
MLGIVVSGHINFASGMRSAVEAIVGQQPQLEFVDFLESMSTDKLELQLLAAKEKVNSGDGVLFLVDLYGGSPCNRAINLLLQDPNVEVVVGVNLSMIVNAALEREEFSVSELADCLARGEFSQIKNLRQDLTALSDDDGDEDGL